MARTFWSGHISFGLVSIPIKLASAVREKDIHFHMLTPDGSCRLRRKLVCPETGKEYDFGQTARGYEIAPDQYVIVEDKELKSLKPEAGRAIEIAQFAPLESIDPVFFSHAYHVVPDEAGARAYRLLMEAMKQSGRVGVARFVMREKEHLATLRVKDDAIVLHTMHYADEIVTAREVAGAASHVALSPKELEMAKKLIGTLDEEFKADEYHDEFRKKVEAMIRRKAEGEEIVTAPAYEEEAPRIINLAEALEKSLRAKREAAKERRTAPKRRRSA